MKKNSLLFLALFLSHNAFSYDLLGEVIPQKSIQVDWYNSYSTTLGVFDVEGLESELTNDDSYSELNSNFILKYALSPKIELGGGINFRYQANNVTTLGSINSANFESGMIYTKYHFGDWGGVNYSVEGRVRQSFYTNVFYGNAADVPNDEIILGDSGTAYDIGLHIGKRLTDTFLISFYGAYSVPGDYISTELIYDVNLGAEITDSFYLSGGLRGITSLNTDEYGDPTQRPLAPTGGVTNRYYSYNREMLEPYGGIGYQGNNFGLYLEASQVVSGRSTDKAFNTGIRLTWRSGGQSERVVKEEKFKTYSVEGSILSVSSKGTFVKIDQGLSSDLYRGKKVDIFESDFFGGNKLMGQGVIVKIGAGWSIVKVTKKYRPSPIKAGFSIKAE